MARARETVRRHDLSIAFLTPPIAWSIYFLVVYPATSTICDLASDGARPLFEGAAYGAAIALTAVTAIAILWSSFVNWRRLRALRSERPAAEVEEGDPHAFMALLGLLMAVFFLIGTFFLALPIIMLGGPCR